MRPVCLLILIQLCFITVFSQVGIGTATPHPSAMLDVASTNSGFLPPRMTTAQRVAINSPANGLLVYQTDGTAGLYSYNGFSWLYIINSTDGSLPVASGGTGAVTLPANTLLKGNGTNAVGTISPSVAGKVLYSDGTSWVAKTATVSSVGSATPISSLPPYLALGYFISISGVFPSFAGLEPYLSEIAIYPYSNAPKNWLLCSGALLSISTNQALYSLLGTTYGGNGSTTFGLPDLRGRMALGTGSLNGTGTFYQIGAKGGSSTITLTTANMPAHTHTITYN